MLSLLSFISVCLLLAFLLGLFLGYVLWFRSRKASVTETGQAAPSDTLAPLSKKLEEREKQLEALNLDLVGVKTERDRLRAEAIPLNARVDELTRSLGEAKKAAGNSPRTLGDLATVVQERDLLKTSLFQAQEQLSAHTQALAQANTNIQTANRSIQTAQAQLQSQATEIERLRKSTLPEPIALQKPVVEQAVPQIKGLVIPTIEPGRQDDLKEIVGVGPFIESKLNALGLRTFKQVALLSPEMLEKVAESIEYFQGRIGRENWNEQCKALHFDKYGEKL